MEYFAKITHLSFFKMWQHVVAMEKTIMYSTVTIQQRMDFRVLSGHFAAWDVLIKRNDCLWRSQLTVRNFLALQSQQGRRMHVLDHLICSNLAFLNDS